MASEEEATEPLNYQTWVLKVSIHCEGCKKKVKKILRNINGVRSVDIDMQQNKVTVTGDVDADTLIQRLAKSGKHADMWPEKKPANPNPSPISITPKAKDKEKKSETVLEKKKKKNLPAADEVTTTDKTSAGTASEQETKHKEGSKKSMDQKEPKNEKKQADTDSETDTKPADTSPANATGSRKKNGKQQGESSSKEGHYGNFPYDRPYPAYPVPVYHHPAYAISHNTAHPMATHSYYYPPVPPQSYTHFGHPYPGYNYNHPPVPLQHSEHYPPVNYNHYNSDNHQYGSSMGSAFPRPHLYPSYVSQEPSRSYSYYESMEPRASPSHSYSSSTQGGLDMFSDENANGCNVM